MVEQLLLSSTVLVAFLGGVVALLAPCCVSVMLPAYFASSFRSTTQVVAMTLVFGAGVGTVMLPIGLGAVAISRLIAGHHTPVFSVMGVAMFAGGVAMLGGWKLMLPMPGMRGRGDASTGSAYVLGVFSGVASSCCAPVLAGVAAVSAATSAFVPALIVGVAFVFGMVAPLAVLALVWDKRDWGSSRLLSGRSVRIRGFGREHAVPLASVLSGSILMAMGVLTIVLAVRGPSMPTDGWQVRLTAWLDHRASQVERGLGFMPTWLPAIAILLALGALLRFGLRRGTPTTATSSPAPVSDSDGSPTDRESRLPTVKEPL